MKKYTDIYIFPGLEKGVIMDARLNLLPDRNYHRPHHTNYPTIEISVHMRHLSISWYMHMYLKYAILSFTETSLKVYDLIFI